MAELDREKISQLEEQLKRNPEAGQALHLAIKAFAALELMKEGFDVRLEKGVKLDSGKGKIMRFDIVGKKDNSLCIVECATHEADVRRAIKKVGQIPADIRRIIVTPQETLREISFDVQRGVDLRELFHEIWIPQLGLTQLVCSAGTSTSPSTIQIYYSLRAFEKEIRKNKKIE